MYGVLTISLYFLFRWCTGRKLNSTVQYYIILYCTNYFLFRWCRGSKLPH